MRTRSLNGFLTAGIGVVIAGALLSSASAQLNPSSSPHGAPTRWHPESNRQKPDDIGRRVHTNVVGLILSEKNVRPPQAAGSGDMATQAAPISGYFFETPSSLACVYGFVAQTSGCNPANANAIPKGGAGLAIAIVDAFHNPSAASDLAAFAKQFGLPAPGTKFQVVYATGTKPPDDTTGWSLESSLDIEWAYAMSPNAKIFLVEAASNSADDLLVAVDKASDLVAKAGGGIVSMSWGGSEFSGQITYDSHFKRANVTYLASSGDSPGVLWPSSSAFVVSVGGTSISRWPSTGNYQGELTWQQAGAGISRYVSRPAYQNSLTSMIGNYRGVPDIAAVADPDTGVWVYAQHACTSIYYCGGTNWVPVGGTSVAAPVEAGVMSYKGIKHAAPQGTLNAIYNGSIGNFRDIISGNCGPYAGYVAGISWDLCTGRGSLLGGMRMMAAGPSAK